MAKQCFLMCGTCLECFDGDGGGVVPQTLPYLTKLSMPELPHKLETGSVNFPLVSGTVREAFSDGFFNLKWEKISCHKCHKFFEKMCMYEPEHKVCVD